MLLSMLAMTTNQRWKAQTASQVYYFKYIMASPDCLLFILVVADLWIHKLGSPFFSNSSKKKKQKIHQILEDVVGMGFDRYEVEKVRLNAVKISSINTCFNSIFILVIFIYLKTMQHMDEKSLEDLDCCTFLDLHMK